MKPLSDLVNRVGRNNVIAIVAIVVLLVLGFILLSKSSSVNNNPSQTSTSGGPVPTAKPTPTTVPGDTVMITFTRPVPAILTLKVGHLLNFANFSGSQVDIEGADANSKDLNIGVMEDSGTSNEILLKTTGTYNYIDKLNSKIKGQIVVTP